MTSTVSFKPPEDLINALDKNSKETIAHFEDRYFEYLPLKSLSSFALEKMTFGASIVTKALTWEDLGHRRVVDKSEVIFNLKNRISKQDRSFLNFNITIPIPTYICKLSKLQRETLAEMLKDPLTSTEAAKSLTIKYLSGNYTYMDLSSEELKVLDEVNFQSTQHFLHSIAKSSKSLKNGLNRFADLGKGYVFQEAFIAEILSKSLAYNMNLDGRSIEIPIPVGTNGKDMKLVTFNIRKIYVGENLPCYIYTPKAKPTKSGDLYASEKEIEQFAKPYMVFRGTEPMITAEREGIREALTADISDMEGISSLPVTFSSDKLLSEISKLASAGDDGMIKKGVIIAGHSLGGVLAQSIGVLFNPLVSAVYAFNSPGVDKHIKGLYDKLAEKNHPERMSEQQEKIIIFHRVGDLLSDFSPYRIGQNFELELQGKERQVTDPFLKHADLMLNTLHVQATVDVQADQQRMGRRILESARNAVLPIVMQIFDNNFGWYNHQKELRKFGESYSSWLDGQNSE